ncbi:hypothetical protein, partial [Streptomyces bottropensis]|uniref:hypothetical protein n=1 Tax=Streptomyces bottropensis TaxID=42235 RepID=UPI0036938F99
ARPTGPATVSAETKHGSHLRRAEHVGDGAFNPLPRARPVHGLEQESIRRGSSRGATAARSAPGGGA